MTTQLNQTISDRSRRTQGFNAFALCVQTVSSATLWKPSKQVPRRPAGVLMLLCMTRHQHRASCSNSRARWPKENPFCLCLKMVLCRCSRSGLWACQPDSCAAPGQCINSMSHLLLLQGNSEEAAGRHHRHGALRG